MRFTQSWLAIGAIVVAVTLPTGTWAMSSLDERVNRLENIVENEFNFDVLNQLSALQQEVQELRGKVEEQQNDLQRLNQKQDKLFTNLDNRIGPHSSAQWHPAEHPLQSIHEPELAEHESEELDLAEPDASIVATESVHSLGAPIPDHEGGAPINEFIN